MSTCCKPNPCLPFVPLCLLAESLESKSSDNGTAAWGQGGASGGGDRRPMSQSTAMPNSMISKPLGNNSNIGDSCNSSSTSSSTFGNWSPPVKKDAPPPGGWTEEERMNGQKGGSFDDGTAVWGNPVRQSKPVSRWKEESPNAKSPNCAYGNAPSQIVVNSSSSNLPPASPGMIRLPPGAPLSTQKLPNDVWNKSQQTPQMNRSNAWPEGAGAGGGIMNPNSNPNQLQQQQQQQPPIRDRDRERERERDTSTNHHQQQQQQNREGWGQVEGNDALCLKSGSGTMPSTMHHTQQGSSLWGEQNTTANANLNANANAHATSPQTYWGNKQTTQPRNPNLWSDGQIGMLLCLHDMSG